MKKLPLYVEQIVSENHTAKLQRAERFERELRTNLMDLDKRITCEKACSHCCYFPIGITIIEGIRIYRSLVDHRLWPRLRDAFEKHRDQTWNLSPEIWLLSETPCPLLKDNLCQIYESRPLTCRTCYATGDPHYCHPHRFTSGDSSLVPRKDVLNEHRVEETKLLKRHNLSHIEMPISAAVLIAERLCKGEFAFEETGNVVMQEHESLG